MKPPSAKSKGRRLQQKVAEDIIHVFPELSGNDVRSVGMGVSGEDIIMSPAAQLLFPYGVECKNCERLNVWAAIEQSKKNCLKTSATTRDEVVVIKKNYTPPYIVVPWKSFLALHKRLRDLTKSTALHRIEGDYNNASDCIDHQLKNVISTNDASMNEIHYAASNEFQNSDMCNIRHIETLLENAMHHLRILSKHKYMLFDRKKEREESEEEMCRSLLKSTLDTLHDNVSAMEATKEDKRMFI